MARIESPAIFLHQVGPKGTISRHSEPIDLVLVDSDVGLYGKFTGAPATGVANKGFLTLIGAVKDSDV